MSAKKCSFTFLGKRYYFYGKTIEEAREKRELKRAELFSRITAGADITLGEWAEICLDLKEMSGKYKDTFTQRVQSHIIKPLGNMRLKDIKPIHCQMCLNLLKGKSSDLIRKVRQSLTWLFNEAILNDLVQTNPCEKITSPKGHFHPRCSLDDIEQKDFLEVCTIGSKYQVFLLMYYLGARSIEARNIKKSDLVYKYGKPFVHIRGTKTDNADRFVPCPPPLLPIFTQECEFIGHNDKNEPLNDVAFRRLFEGVRKAKPRLEKHQPYALRHTYCTNLINVQGVPINLVQRAMGHSNISTTMRYTHTNDFDLLKIFDSF